MLLILPLLGEKKIQKYEAKMYLCILLCLYHCEKVVAILCHPLC